MLNKDHLEILIRLEKKEKAKELLVELRDYVDTLSSEEYNDLVVGIKNGTITDLYPINER